MKYDYSNLPKEMTSQKRWVLFKLVELDDGRMSKKPLNAFTGRNAKSNDPTTWAPFIVALNKCDFYQADGLGFMLGDGFVGVDLDHTLTSNFELCEEFMTIINSYTETSQSGDGLHIICKGELPQGNRRKGKIEMYDSSRFFALTGQVYRTLNKFNENATEGLKSLHAKYLYEEPVSTQDEAFKVSKISNLTDHELIQKASLASNGAAFSKLYNGNWEDTYPSQSEADMAFASSLAFWAQCDFAQMDRIFRGSGLMRPKYDRKLGDTTYGAQTLNNAIAHTKEVYQQEERVNSLNDTPIEKLPIKVPPIRNFKAVVDNIKVSDTTRPRDDQISVKDYDFTDTGNAIRFIDLYGNNIRYNYDNKYWVIYDGKTWVKDDKQVVKNLADEFIMVLKKEAKNERDTLRKREMDKNIRHLSSNSGKEAMLKEAQHIGEIPTTNKDYDKHTYLLNCKNGVIDLKTGKLMKHNKSYMLSKCTNIDCVMDQKPLKWIKFLKEIFKGNQDMVDYVQTAIGYTLTGDTKEQCFFQCYGDGANGKSVFLDIIYAMLGDYSLNTQAESILAKGFNSGNGANSDIARMNGARFVRTNEPNEGSRFNEGLVKQLVSGDVTTARFLYGGEFEFTPRFKMWIATNYKIIIRGTDGGIWRRMRLVPFECKFEGDKADKNLTEKLREELPQILGWAVKGCLKWRKEGLLTPKEIEQANKEYRSEMNVVSAFISDCVKEDANSREKASDVYREYSFWARNGNEYLMSSTKFGTELSKRFEKRNIAGNIYYLGIILKKNDRSYVFEKDRV